MLAHICGGGRDDLNCRGSELRLLHFLIDPENREEDWNAVLEILPDMRRRC